jgi:hypothetical protein
MRNRRNGDAGTLGHFDNRWHQQSISDLPAGGKMESDLRLRRNPHFWDVQNISQCNRPENQQDELERMPRGLPG